MSTSNLILKNNEIHFTTVKYFGLVSICSADYVGTGYINDGSTMDQLGNDGLAP